MATVELSRLVLALSKEMQDQGVTHLTPIDLEALILGLRAASLVKDTSPVIVRSVQNSTMTVEVTLRQQPPRWRFELFQTRQGDRHVLASLPSQENTWIETIHLDRPTYLDLADMLQREDAHDLVEMLFKLLDEMAETITS